MAHEGAECADDLLNGVEPGAARCSVHSRTQPEHNDDRAQPQHRDQHLDRPGMDIRTVRVEGSEYPLRGWDRRQRQDYP